MMYSNDRGTQGFVPSHRTSTPRVSNCFITAADSTCPNKLPRKGVLW
jgi:hypothetical protein